MNSSNNQSRSLNQESSVNQAPSLADWQNAVGRTCAGDTQVISQWLAQVDDGPSNSQRLQVYRNNYLGTRLGIIDQSFPSLFKLLGQEYLHQCSRRFIDTCDELLSADLNSFGQNFPNFLHQLQRQKSELSSYPWLAELAELDYQLHSIYYSSDDGAFDFESFQQQLQRPETLYFKLSHSLVLLECEWPIADIHKDISQHQVRQDYRRDKQILCVYRQQLSVNYDVLSSGEADLLTQLSRQQSMHHIVTTNPAAQKLLPAFIQRGWICGFTLQPDSDPSQAQDDI